MDNLQETEKVVVGLSGLVVFGLAFLRLVYRRIIRDGLETAKDRGETDLIDRLQENQRRLDDLNNSLRAECSRLSQERGDTLSKLGRLEAENDQLKERLLSHQSEIAILRRKLGLILDVKP